MTEREAATNPDVNADLNAARDQIFTPPPRRIAVYGSLRRAEYNHARVNGWGRGVLTHVADGYIEGAELINLGSYPAIVPSTDKSKQVVVEVYDCPEALYQLIDMMEVGAGYAEAPVGVTVNDNAIMPASAYFYENPEELAKMPRITSGDWSHRTEASTIQRTGDEVV